MDVLQLKLALILLMFYRPQGLFGYMEITSLAPFKRFLKGGKSDG